MVADDFLSRCLGSNQNASARRACEGGILDQVDEHPAEFGLVSGDHGQFDRQIDIHSQSAFTEGFARVVSRRLYDRVDRRGDLVRGFAASKAPHSLHDLAAARDVSLDSSDG